VRAARAMVVQVSAALVAGVLAVLVDTSRSAFSRYLSRAWRRIAVRLGKRVTVGLAQSSERPGLPVTESVPAIFLCV
jgi:hypothetical protein